MTSQNDVQKAATGWFQRTLESRRKYGYLGTGQAVADPFSVAGMPGYVWMRVVKGGKVVSVTSVLNAGTNAVQRRPDLAVFTEPNAEGIDEIKGTWTAAALPRYGEALKTLAQAETDAEANRDLIPSRNLMPGRIRIVNGLEVTLEPFWYIGADGKLHEWKGEASGTITLTAPSAVSSEDQQRWTLIEFDPSVPELTVQNGPVQNTLLPLDETGIEAFTPTAQPAWAVKLATGDTAIDFDNGLEDVRLWFGTEADEGVYTPNFAQTIDQQDNLLQRSILRDYAEELVVDTNSGSTQTIDLEAANVQEITLTADCTFTFSNPPATGKAGSFTLILRQDGTGGWATTWPASVQWAGGTPPTLTTTTGAVDVLSFLTVDGGGAWMGFLAGLDFS